MASYRNEQWVIHPRTKVICDGWESNAHALIQNGWHIEKMYDQSMLNTKIYMRNPSKYMTACIMIDEYRNSNHPSRYMQETPYMYFGSEDLLLRAEMYKEMEIPKVELQEVWVGEAIAPPDRYRGLREHDPSMWRFYTPKGEADASEVIITPDKIPELLSIIQDMQEPRAKEIIHAQRKRSTSELRTEAKILSFG